MQHFLHRTRQPRRKVQFKTQVAGTLEDDHRVVAAVQEVAIDRTVAAAKAGLAR